MAVRLIHLLRQVARPGQPVHPVRLQAGLPQLVLPAVVLPGVVHLKEGFPDRLVPEGRMAPDLHQDRSHIPPG